MIRYYPARKENRCYATTDPDNPKVVPWSKLSDKQRAMYQRIFLPEFRKAYGLCEFDTDAKKKAIARLA